MANFYFNGDDEDMATNAYLTSPEEIQRLQCLVKNKGFVSNKSVSVSVGKSIRGSKSTMSDRVRRSEVSIAMTGDRDILGVSNGARVGEVVDIAINFVGMVVDLLEAVRKVHLVGAI